MRFDYLLTAGSAKNASFATVIIGPPRARFIVHEDLLIFHSPFFCAALTGNFKEVADKEVVLVEENEQTFEIIVHWLYHTRFPNSNDAEALFALWSNADDHGKRKTGNLICLYVFAIKYRVPKLKAKAMDGLYSHMHENNWTELHAITLSHMLSTTCPMTLVCVASSWIRGVTGQAKMAG